jgi:hypothetical protein
MYTFTVIRLMSDNPERPYIGRIVAMWQDKAGDFVFPSPAITALRLSKTWSRVVLDTRSVVL